LKFPITIQDNFFQEPKKLVEYFKSLPFTFNDNNYPGTRTDCLSRINYDLYDSICLKALSFFQQVTGLEVGSEEILYNCTLTLQKIPSNYGQGWVHHDYPAAYTFLIYLNENYSIDGGTSFYRVKDEYKHIAIDKANPSILRRKEYAYELETNERIKEIEKDREANNKLYEKTIDVGNIFNRFIMFDADTPHAQNNMDHDQERLTLVGFLNFTNAISPTRRSNYLISV
jgi:hypothetical protein